MANRNTNQRTSTLLYTSPTYQTASFGLTDSECTASPRNPAIPYTTASSMISRCIRRPQCSPCHTTPRCLSKNLTSNPSTLSSTVNAISTPKNPPFKIPLLPIPPTLHLSHLSTGTHVYFYPRKHHLPSQVYLFSKHTDRNVPSLLQHGPFPTPADDLRRGFAGRCSAGTGARIVHAPEPSVVRCPSSSPARPVPLHSSQARPGPSLQVSSVKFRIPHSFLRTRVYKMLLSMFSISALCCLILYSTWLVQAPFSNNPLGEVYNKLIMDYE